MVGLEEPVEERKEGWRRRWRNWSRSRDRGAEGVPGSALPGVHVVY